MSPVRSLADIQLDIAKHRRVREPDFELAALRKEERHAKDRLGHVSDRLDDMDELIADLEDAYPV